MVIFIVAVMIPIPAAVPCRLFLLIRRTALDATYPSCRCSGSVEIEQAGMQNLVQIHICIVAVDYLGYRLESPDNRPYLFQFFRLYFRGLVEQDDIAEFYLLYDQVGDILLADIFLRKFVPASEFVTQPEGIYDCGDAVQAACAVFRIRPSKGRDVAYCLGDRLRFADAAGFDYDIVEFLHLRQFEYLLNQVCPESAADAAVLQGHKTVVLLRDDTA